MHIMQAGDGRRSGVRDHRSRNSELFGRRRRLQERLEILRAEIAAGEADASAELELRTVEREYEDLTYEIMTANYGLVRRYVATFTAKGTEHREDFESAGKVGLLWAISSYDPALGSFSTWAFKPIQREVLRAVRDADHPNLNPGDFEKRPAILAAAREFVEASGADASLDYADIARRAAVTEGQARRVLNAPRLDSLQALSAGHDADETPWAERLTDSAVSVEDEVLLRFDLRALSDRGLPRLDARERYVLTRRFGLDGESEESLRIIGDQLGLSREGVRQIQEKALSKLHEPFADTA